MDFEKHHERMLLQHNKAIAEIDSIDNIQVRYINRLEVPSQDFDPGSYFAGFGTAPEGMMRGPFLHQDVLQHARVDVVAVVQQVLYRVGDLVFVAP